MMHGAMALPRSLYVDPGEVLAGLDLTKANFPSRDLLDAFLAGAGVLGAGTVEESDAGWKVVLVTGDFASTRTNSPEPGVSYTIARPRVASFADVEFDTAPWNFDASAWSVEDLMHAVPKAVAAWAKKQAKEKGGEVVKADLKLPYHTEDGKVNVAAMRAVKSILGGGRGGVDLPADVKAKVTDEMDAMWAMWQEHQEKMKAKMAEHTAFAEADAVEIFEAGTYRGRTWTVDDLDEIVANFPKAGIDAPLAIGHDEDQALLKSSGLPAAGWCEKVWRQGKKLMAKFRDVPQVVADLIAKKAYRKRSAEIYLDYSNGVQRFGKVLRRVSLLGAEMPQVKTLADIQALYCAESPEGQTEIITFEEATMPEAVKDKEQDKGTASTIPQVAPKDQQAQAGVQAKTPDAPPPADMHAFAEQVTAKVRAELQPQIVKLQEQLAEKDKTIATHAEKFKAAEGKALRMEVDLFCSDMRRQGRLTPAECVGVVQFMEALHGANTVVKYADGGKDAENTLVGFFKDLIQKREPAVPVPGRDHLPDDTSPRVMTAAEASQKIAKMAEELARTEKIGIPVAIERVVAKHPDLEHARVGRR